MYPLLQLSRPFAVLTLALAAGCAHTSGGIAPSTLPLGTRAYDDLGHVECTSNVIYLLGILPISGSNSTQDAISEALSKKPGADGLIQVTSDTTASYWILWSANTIRVEGNAFKFR